MNNSIYSRRSIRKYLNKQVPKELIEQVVDADGRFVEICDNVIVQQEQMFCKQG